MFQPLQTERLLLRRLLPSDARTMFDYRSNPEVSRYQNWQPSSIEEVCSFIQRLGDKEPLRAGQWFQLGIALRDTDELIGDCGIHASAEECRSVELGITLAPLSQRRGLALEAFTALLEYLFTQTETHRVHCSVDPRNLPCIRLLEKAGLRQEAHLIESLCIRGEWVDDLLFAILRREWPSGGFLAHKTKLP